MKILTVGELDAMAVDTAQAIRPLPPSGRACSYCWVAGCVGADRVGSTVSGKDARSWASGPVGR